MRSINGAEVITLLGGTVTLDASFNVGGDTVVLPGASGGYTATLSGSFVTLTGGDVSVAIPVGIAGVTVAFDDSSPVLRYDTASGQVMLGDFVVTANSGTIAAALPKKGAEMELGITLDELAGGEVGFPLEAHHKPSVEIHRLDFSESFSFA